MLIIGITGTIGAGKGTIVDYLVQSKGFSHYSVRAFLIDEIKRRNMPVDRDSMVVVANDLRAKYKPSYIIEQLYNAVIDDFTKHDMTSEVFKTSEVSKHQTLNTKHYIIESIRNQSEADFLKHQTLNTKHQTLNTKHQTLNTKHYIIESIRNQSEADFLKHQTLNTKHQTLNTKHQTLNTKHQTLNTKHYFYLFAVDANPEIRYQRILKRQSETDKISYDEFLMNEQREMSSTDPNNQNIAKCISMADFTFTNNTTIPDLIQQLDKVIKEIIKP